jgi:DNA-binding transcriptional regulator YhcF (GntR family)
MLIYITLPNIYWMSEKYLRQEVSYNSNRPLESIFRNNISRILDFLILNPQFDYSTSEMSKITKVPPRTIQRVLPHLVAKELVKETGKVGNTKMYILNTQSELAEVLRRYVQTAINVNINNARKQHISVQINEKPMP